VAGLHTHTGIPGAKRAAARAVTALALIAAMTACTAPRYYTEADRAALRAPIAPSAEPAEPQPARPARAAKRVPRPPEPPTADKVVVVKSARELRLLADGNVFARYPIALGGEPVGPKRRRGDQRTPEGRYVLDWRNPESVYYRAIHISYPAPRDRRYARRHDLDPGDGIMIHGLPEKYRWMGEHHVQADWTNGCIAVTNAEMDRIWKRVPDGTPILIQP